MEWKIVYHMHGHYARETGRQTHHYMYTNTHTATRIPNLYINNQKGQTDGKTKNSEYIHTVLVQVRVQCRCRGDEENCKDGEKRKTLYFQLNKFSSFFFSSFQHLLYAHFNT